MKREEGASSAGPSSSLSAQLRENHGKAGALLGIRAVGRRTAGRRIPHRSRKPRLNWKDLEELAITDVAAAADAVQKKSSKYRGVTKHRVTERYEAHLWDKSAYNVKQKKKGRQVYLGAYDEEIAAARAYDLAALKYWGSGTLINFKLGDYAQQLKEMEKISREEYLATLRRKSSGFSRGVSKYRGVARHHHNGRWEARIGRVEGNKYLYLGTYSTQEEAAEAYDKAAIKYRGAAAMTNFELSRYSELFQNIPAKKGPKSNTSKSSLKDSRVAKNIGDGDSSQAMQMLGNVIQPVDGDRNLPTAEIGGMNVINSHNSLSFLGARHHQEQEKMVLRFPDSYPGLEGTAETSGLNNLISKQEGFPNLPVCTSAQEDLMALGSEYEDILAGFDMPTCANLDGMLSPLSATG